MVQNSSPSTEESSDETLTVADIDEGDTLSDDELKELGIMTETRFGHTLSVTRNDNVIAKSNHVDGPVSYMLVEIDGSTLSLARHTRQLDSDNFTVVKHVSDSVETEAVPLSDEIEDADLDSDVIEDVREYHSEVSEIMLDHIDCLIGTQFDGKTLYFEEQSGEELKRIQKDLGLNDREKEKVRKALSKASPETPNSIESGGMITTHAVELYFQ